MVRRSFRVGLGLGIAVGIVVALVKSLQGQRDARELAAPPAGRWDQEAPPLTGAEVAGAADIDLTQVVVVDEQAEAGSTSWAEEQWADDVLPAPAESEGEAAPEGAPTRRRPARAWVEPTGAVCPQTHPVKAKMASGLFHLPGMLNYTRTRPDRCYASEDAALADGLTKSKR